MTSKEVLGKVREFPETSPAPHMGNLQHLGSGLRSLLRLLQREHGIYLKQQLHADVSRFTFSKLAIVFFLVCFSNADTQSLWRLLICLSY